MVFINIIILYLLYSFSISGKPECFRKDYPDRILSLFLIFHMKVLANLLRVTTIIFFVAQATVVNADRGQNKEKHDKKPTGAPIDGGASLLLAGGFAYVARRISKARSKSV